MRHALNSVYSLPCQWIDNSFKDDTVLNGRRIHALVAHLDDVFLQLCHVRLLDRALRAIRLVEKEWPKGKGVFLASNFGQVEVGNCRED